MTLATDASGNLTAASNTIFNVWQGRDYINNSVNGKSSTEAEYGDTVVTGYVGRDDGNDTWNGTSVRWSIRTKEGVSSLVLYPSNNVSGTMRAFNPNNATRAPWNNSGQYANAFTQVVFLGKITAQGSLNSMFEGCTRLVSADMRGLTITDATTDTSHMFSGCTSLPFVTNQNQVTDYEAKLDMPEGVFLPATLNPTSAASMFEGCTGLTDGNASGATEGRS